MSQIEKSLTLLEQLEHSSNPSKVLHKNKHENGLTYWGIYEAANPNWKGWCTVKTCLEFYDNKVKITGRELYNTTWLHNMVKEFYKKEYWDKAKLDKVYEQKIADEIFIFGVNVGMTIAIMKAQKLVGAKADGWVGNETLGKLNSFDVNKFDIEFDEYEKKGYKTKANLGEDWAHILHLHVCRNKLPL